MYKVIVTTNDGTSVAASKKCRTKEEAEKVRTKLLMLLQKPVSIEIKHIGKP